METMYYLTSVLLFFGLPVLVIGIIIYLIRPSLLNKSKYVTSPVSRGKIAAVGLTALVVAFLGFGSVLSATEPASVKQQRLSREAVIKDAELKRLQDIEQERLKQVEAAKPKLKTEAKIEPVPFESVEQSDSTIPLGERRVSREGINGERTITTTVTYANGKEISRKETKNEITKAPTNKLTLVGTYVAPTPSAQQHSTSSNGVRTGATCNDGTHSGATGRGACSHHGGVAQWLY